MTTEISKTHKDKSVFQTFADFLKDTWKSDDKRPEIYSREQQFSFFWDNRDVVDRPK
jgi:hypothetical protein